MSKHKRKAKRLLTCPTCGISGFVNLKHHRCKKGRGQKSEVSGQTLELVGPAESLKEIEAELSPVMDRVSRKTEDLLYDLVLAGLFLMKAQLSHRVCTVAHSADGKLAGHGEDTGFQGWLEEKYPNISRRTAYNYINGANNCGLKVTDGPEAIEALRKAHALAGKTASDIYKLKDQEPITDNQEPAKGARWELMRDAAVKLREQCEAIEELRDGMNKKVFSTVCARLHRTLENITGSPWDIVDKKQTAKFKEHGDVYELGS